MKKKFVTVMVCLHPIQVEIINLMRKGITIENHTLRSIGSLLSIKNGELFNSPQLIKHHLTQLVKLGVLNVINGKYENNDIYAKTIKKKYKK